jgi:hypothetical protein
LRIRTAPRPIPAAAHFARNDGGAQRLLGATVGGIKGRIDEEAEERRQLYREMAREPLHLWDHPRVGERVKDHTCDALPAGQITRQQSTDYI